MKLIPDGRWTRLALVAAAAVAAHAMLGALGVPWLVRRQLPALARERLHRELTLSAASFNPYALRATLVGLDLRDRDGGPLVSADTLVLDLAASSLVRRGVVLDEIRVHHPDVTLRLGPDGRPTVADLLADSAPPAAGAPVAMPRLAIRHASMRAGEIDLVDESRAPVYRESLRDLELALDQISTFPDEDGTHDLTARIADGATIKWKGDATLEPLRLEGRFDVEGARLPKLSDAFASALPLRLVAGEADASLPYRVERAADGTLTATLPGADLTLRGLAARPPGTDAEWVRAERVEVRGVQVTWPAREAVVRAVRVHKPWLRAVRLADGTIEWQTLRPAEPGDVPPAEGPPWRVRVDSVGVREGTVHVEDRTVTPALALDATPLELDLAGVTTDSTQAVGVRLVTSLGGASRMSVSGSVTPAPFRAELDVAAERLDVRLAQRYLGPDAPITLASGTATVRGKATMGPGRPATAFDGQASVEGVVIRDAVGDSLLGWRTMRVAGLRYTASPDLVRVREVRLGKPFARIAISRERELNLMRIRNQLLGDTAATEPPYPYEVGAVVFEDGVVDFSDESLILPFRTLVDSARGSITDVASFGATPGSLTLEGLVDRDGLAKASGSLHPADPFAATDVKVEFRNLDLTRFTPYSAQFMGYAIKGGRLDMDLRYKVLERNLDADHHIVAKDLQLGDKVEGGESPGFLVKLAISLLKDKDGRITLDVPVSGTVDDPQFSYRSIVWTAMKQILGKIATAPFRFFGKLLGIGGDAPELVEFEPGRSDLIPPEREKLDSLAALLERKPELVLGVSGRYDPVTDAAAIREAKLGALVAARRDSLFRKKQADDTSFTTLGRTLESLYASLYSEAALDSLRDSVRVAVKADPAKASRKPRKGYETPGYFETMHARMLAAQTADSAELVELARARAASVVAQLTAAGLADPTRIGEPTLEPVKAKKEGSPRVASELKMDAK